jgi:hypothetical protein
VKRLKEEKEQGEALNATIEKRWQDISKLVVPQEIAAAIAEQDDECAKVFRSKQAVITEFEEELNAKVVLLDM